MVDQLAVEYAGRPAVFLENDVDAPIGGRLDRWWAAYNGSGTVYLPLVMVSSGHAISSGWVDFHSVFAGLVDAELARPAQAEIAAYCERVGATMRVWVRLINRSEVALSAGVNAASVRAVIWEDAKVGVTSRTIRAVPSAPIDGEVTPGGAFAVTLESGPLSGVDWSKLHAVAFVEYRPAGASGAYDMLQAGIAAPPELSVEPQALDVRLPHDGADDVIGTLAVRGPYVLNWTASTDAVWLAVDAGAGPVPADVTVRVIRGQMPAGIQQGRITFTASSADGLSFTRTVDVKAEIAPALSRLRRRLLRAAPTR